MFKKLIISIAVLFTVFTYGVSAQVSDTEVSFNPVTLEVSVDGKCSGAKDKQYILLEFINEENETAAAEQVSVLDESFSLDGYMLPENLDVGYYSVKISVMNMNGYCIDKAFYYGGRDGALELLNKINSASGADEINEIIVQNYTALGFAYFDIYNECTSKNMLLKRIIDTDLSATKINLEEKWQLLLSILSKDTLLTYFSDTESADEIKNMLQNKKYIELMGFDIEKNPGEFHVFTELSEQGLTEAYKLIAADKANELDDAFNMLRRNAFTAFLRTGRYTDAEKALKDIDDIFNINYTDYNKLSQANKNSVLKSTADYAKSVSDAQLIAKQFETLAAKKLSENIPERGGNVPSISTGGNGGGGGYAPPAATSKPTEDNGVTFTDIDNVEWAKEAITALSNKGVLSGVGGGLFAPNDNVTRAQFCKIAAECFGITADSVSGFSDVADNAWYAKYVNALAKIGIINGVGNNCFAPDAYITRQDLAVILSRIISKCNFEIPLMREPEKFGDDNIIAEYAKDSVYSLCRFGLLNGSDGNVLPLDNATRAQAASLIYRIEVAR